MKSGGEVVEEAALTEDGGEGRLPRSMITPIAGLRSMSHEPRHQLGSRCVDVSSGDGLDPVTPSHAHHSGRLTLGHILVGTRSGWSGGPETSETLAEKGAVVGLRCSVKWST
jgi:hypothetical protein